MAITSDVPSATARAVLKRLGRQLEEDSADARCRTFFWGTNAKEASFEVRNWPLNRWSLGDSNP